MKKLNQRAWLFVAPVLILVAFNALIPLMTVVNYSVQETFGDNVFFWHGVGWFEDLLRSERFHNALGRQFLFTFSILLIEVPLGVAIALAIQKLRVRHLAKLGLRGQAFALFLFTRLFFFGSGLAAFFALFSERIDQFLRSFIAIFSAHIATCSGFDVNLSRVRGRGFVTEMKIAFLVAPRVNFARSKTNLISY